jgi:ElaB/YqjD/DUF883 family membrane-anchored ribosome-binding protein
MTHESPTGEVEIRMAQVRRALRENMIAADRLAKRGRYAAEDALEEARHEIKRHPFEAVAASFGIGVGVGILSAWLYRNGHK